MKKLLFILLALVALPAYSQITLRQSDAIELKFGPLVDATDGVTAETALTISQADVQLSKCGAAGTCAAFAQKNDANACTHDAGGWYECALNTTDTDTVGILYVSIQESGAAPYWAAFSVVETSIYDASLADAVTASVAQTGDSYARLGAPAGASVSADIAAIEGQTDDIGAAGAGLTALGGFTAGAITAAAIADNAIDAASTAADFSTEVQDADVESVNGVTILGDGSATPFNVSYEAERLQPCYPNLTKRALRKYLRFANKHGLTYAGCNTSSI